MRADTDLEFFPVLSYSFYMFVRLFRFHRFASGVRPLFEAHPIKEGAYFVYFYSFLASVQLTVFTSSRLLANRLSNSGHLLTSAWWWREDHIRFRWFQTCAEDLGPTIFSSHF